MTKIIQEALNGLSTSPMLLALISLNVIMVGAGLWFIRALAAAQQHRFDLLLKLCGGGKLP